MMQLTQSRTIGSSVLAIGVMVALVAALLLAPGRAYASSTFTVTNTYDSGPGSLRQAIIDANATLGADVIDFDVAGTGVHTIAPTSQLPKITDTVTINGYTQPGAKPNQKAFGSDAVLNIELSGAKVAYAPGLVIGASNSTVRGLVINHWDDAGIRIEGSGATGNKVAGNYVGTDASATQRLANGFGVLIHQAPSNTVGGTTVAARNILSGNSYGVVFGGGKGNKVTGNYIGTDASGTHDLGNSEYGVGAEGAVNSVIGGTTAAERNIISGNDSGGVIFAANGNKVRGNFIGTDASGTQDLGNNGNGVRLVSSSNNVIGGTTAGERNVISGNGDSGIRIENNDSTGNKVAGNFVGTDKNGTARLGNANDGVNIEGASNNTVGGTTAGERNVISGNGLRGINISGADATGNKVAGNFIGTDKSGVTPLGNGYDGVRLNDAPNNTVGGVTAGARNVISANKNNGVLIYGNGATGNRIAGNFVGTDVSGTKDRGNTFDGVSIDSGSNNIVGGTTAGERNVISGNGSDGVDIRGIFVTGNRVVGNYLGVDKDGAPLGNSANGVFIYDAPNNTIGGTTAGAGNVISANFGSGVSIFNSTATGDRVLSNSIFANGGLGIDLGDDGPTANDPMDPDTGPNNLQNKPVLISAKTGSSTTTIRGNLNSAADSTFLIRFFSNPSGGDEGKTFIGQELVTTDASGDATYAFTPAQKVDVGRTVTATATGSDAGGSTSEFSGPRTVIQR